MNSYLDLVKEYAEKHKRKNRMSLFVILLAVALVATIFGMADMELQTQQISMKKQYGSWHIGIKDMAKEQEKSFLPFHMRSACILWITCLNYIKMGHQLLYLPRCCKFFIEIPLSTWTPHTKGNC